MKQLITALEHLIFGQRKFTTNLIFSVLMFSVSMVHLCYAGFFYFQHLDFLFYYHLFVIFLYIGNGFLMYYQKYRLASFATLTEIWLCGILFSLLLGWNTGFALFHLALVPILYYISFATGIFKRMILTPTLLSLFSLCIYLICRLITRVCTPYYADLKEPFIICMYLFNSITAFIIVIVFSLFFLYEIQRIQSALRIRNRHLDKMASIDSLTHLWNRRSMNVFLENAVNAYQNTNQEFSLILCDIDDFKLINDTYGHSCGDEVLTHISNLIRSCVRSDDFVCRWGGEEILILVQGPLPVAKVLAERIRAQVELTPTLYEEKEVHHTMTFGISPYQPDCPVEESIRTADNNLYVGKRHGKNQVIV